MRPGSAEVMASVYSLMRGNERSALSFVRQAKEHSAAPEIEAFCLYQSGDLTGALAAAERALCAGSASRDLIELAIALNFQVGDFRIASAMQAAGYSRLRGNARAWSGEPLNGKTVFVCSGSPLLRNSGAMGFGDEIMYARFIPELAKRGACVYLKCSDELRELFGTVPGLKPGTGTFDFWIDPMELPHRLGIERETIPRPPYLSAKARAKPEGFSIGLSWGCGAIGPKNRYCFLSELAELSNLPGVRLYSLEKSGHVEQLYPAPQGMRVTDLAPSINDFHDMAAAIQSMDLIVSTDNVVANLAGALDKPLFLLAPFVADWRWGIGERSPWYPSARIFRQAKWGSFRPVVSRVAKAIRQGV